MTSYSGIGLMSGTSCDGIDVCHAEFTGDMAADIWAYRILHATTVPYSEVWKERLNNAANLNGYDLIKLHTDYGHLLGQTVQNFIEEHDIQVDFVASHGHTVFHQPDEKVTFQMGDGETMSSYLHTPLITNFRAKDVALGGQGAPIVPYGERKLFTEHDICINFGGIANTSFDGKGYDICPCNMVLNKLAQLENSNVEYDQDGNMAESGEIIEQVYLKLNKLEYYALPPPKSTGREWVEENIMPILDTKKYKIVDLLCTFVEHICHQVSRSIKINKKPTITTASLLITGGGAFNKYLIKTLNKKLREQCLDIDISETDNDTINYKEALIMAFLGLHCMLGLPNVSCSVTGARMDSVCGSVHMPPNLSDACLSKKRDYGFMLGRSDSIRSSQSYNSDPNISESESGNNIQIY